MSFRALDHDWCCSTVLLIAHVYNATTNFEYMTKFRPIRSEISKQLNKYPSCKAILCCFELCKTVAAATICFNCF